MVEVKTMVEPALLNEKEAAKYISMSTSYLRKSRMDGDIKDRLPAPPFVRIGQKNTTIRYRLSDLKKWVEDLPAETHEKLWQKAQRLGETG